MSRPDATDSRAMGAREAGPDAPPDAPPGETIPLRLVGVGPQRTGSTWLDRQLRRHPALALPTHVKETFFFDRHHARGLADYRAHFASAVGAWAEVAPTYFDDPDVPARIARVAPGVRAVIPLRDPVARAISLWQHHLRKGRVPPDFWAASEILPRILTAGDYATHLARWTDVLGEDRVLVLLLKDIHRDPQGAMDAITTFAGIGPIGVPPEEHAPVNTASAPRFPRVAALGARAVTRLRDARLHRVVEAGKALGLAGVYRGGGPPPGLSDADRRRLAERYAPHIEAVERRLGRPTGWSRR